MRKKRLPPLRRVLSQGKWSSMSDDRKLTAGHHPRQIALIGEPRASEANPSSGFRFAFSKSFTRGLSFQKPIRIERPGSGDVPGDLIGRPVDRHAPTNSQRIVL